MIAHTSSLGQTRASQSKVAPTQAIPTLKKHMLVDGYEIILDLKNSKGSYIVDAGDGKRYLDFFTFVASSPVGLNHPKMTSPEFLEKISRVAVHKPSNSDIYTVEQAEFVDTLERVAMRLACRLYNLMYAEEVYGREHMKKYRKGESTIAGGGSPNAPVAREAQAVG